MRQFIIRRILISIVVLIGVSLLLYGIVRAMPADYVTLATSSAQKITEAQKEHLREIYGLNKGYWAGYFDWISHAVRGDLGISLSRARPVMEVIKQYAPVTFSLALIALAIELAVGIPLGILAARKRNTKTDYLITAFVFLGISIPSFFFAALLKRSLGFSGLNLFPVIGLLNPKVIYNGFSFAKLLDMAHHLVLPLMTLALTQAGTWLRFTRSGMIDALSSDYVRTARAKGVPERRVIYTHAYRNTLIPIITLLGAQLPALFSGAVITENLFAIEGLGNIALKAANISDAPYLMGFNMLLAVCTVIGFLISDILYAVADPRVRLS